MLEHNSAFPLSLRAAGVRSMNGLFDILFGGWFRYGVWVLVYDVCVCVCVCLCVCVVLVYDVFMSVCVSGVCLCVCLCVCVCVWYWCQMCV